MNSFTFYKNYYDLIDNLPQEDKRMMLEVIVDYMFRDVEPIGLEKMNLAIWNNIKMPLDTSKKNVENGKRGGRPKKEEKNPNDNPKQNPNGNPNNNPNDNPNGKQIYISTFLFLISNFKYLQDKGLLREKIEEWLKYKWERKEYYKETGFKTLLAQIERATSQYGVENMIELINECMANNYKGIIFEKLKNKPIVRNESIPEWFDKSMSSEVSVDESDEMKSLLESMSE